MASLRKNVASQHISFVLVNASTGAALTGATFTSKAWIAKDGSQAGFAGTFTELGNGQYDYAPTQTETNCTSFGLAINPTSSIPVNLQMFTDNWDTTAAVLTSGSGAAQIAVNGSGAVSTVTTLTNQLTAAAIATGVWQDSTSGDFTTASSIGKGLYTSGVVPGGTNGLFIAGTNAATAITTGLTAHIIGTVDTLTTYTGNTPQTGDAYARIGAAGAGLTALGDTRIAHLDTDVSSRTKPADTQAAVTLVTTTTNLTNAPTAGDFTAAMKTSLNAATPASVVGAVGSVIGSVGGSVGSVTAPVTITSNIKKNATTDLSFPMTDATTGALATGLTVVAQRSIDGAALAACANAVTEIGGGIYNISLAASDTNGNAIMYKFTATGANAQLLEIITQP